MNLLCKAFPPLDNPCCCSSQILFIVALNNTRSVPPHPHQKTGTKKEKKPLNLNVNAFSTKVLIRVLIRLLLETGTKLVQLRTN